ncbi:MAG: outer membrane lipoprotein carrier protein LolA [Syntrophales bacterium]|nr:outer membrane lipoprotein carrier protein LolA [Syntrophales bacterium]
MDFVKTNGRASSSLFCIGILLSCAAMLGWAGTWEDIQRESAKVKSVSARFSQEKHLQILTKPIVSKGHFYFQAPDMVRWEYASPVKSVLLMRKGYIKKYTLGSKGLVEDSGGAAGAMQIVLQEIIRWNKGQFTGDEYFSAILKGEKEPKIILTPKEKGLSAIISRIVINFSPDKPGVLRSVKIIESEGNYTIFQFTDVQVNVKISKLLFEEAG